MPRGSFSGFIGALRPCMFGLAFVHMWIYCSTHRFLESDGVSVTTVLYLSMSVLLVALGAALWRRRGAAGGASEAGSGAAGASAFGAAALFAGRRGVVADAVAAVFMALGGVALSVGLPVGPAASTAIGAALGGLGVAWAYGRWIQVYARLDLRFAAPLLFLTMAFGSTCKACIDFLPGAVAAAVLVCLPFATFACARRASTRLPEAPEPVRYYNSRTIGSLSRVVLSVAAFSFTFGIIRSTFLTVTPEPYVASVLVNHGSEILIALLYVRWILVERRGVDFGRTWRLILILMVTVFVFESFLAGTDAHALLFALIRTAHALLVVFFLFLAVADVARHSSYDPLAVYAVGWVVYTLPFAAGSAFGSVLASGPLAPLVSSIATWMLVVVALVLLDDRSLGNQLIFADLNGDSEDALDADAPAARALAAQRVAASQLGAVGETGFGGGAGGGAAGEGGAGVEGGGGPGSDSGSRRAPTDGAGALRARCQRLARQHGLTSRECEVLELLVRGHSKTRIAETFLISENTVRGHVKHIYAKLDVHSKQELLDLVGA